MLNEVVTQSGLANLLGSSITECNIEITNVCPFFCDHCYVEKSEKMMMSFDTFKKIIDELISLNCYFILITGGEPLANPNFIKMYEYAKRKGMFVNINSNGYLINDKVLDVFKKYKPNKIEISLYGYNNKTYNDFVHVENAFSIVLKNINELKKLNIRINLKSVLTKRNFQYIDKLKKLSNELDLSFRYDYIIFPKLGLKNEINPEALSMREIINVIKQDVDDSLYFQNAVKMLEEYKNKDNYISNIFQCSMGKDKIFIDSFGNIKLCLVVPEARNISNYSIRDAVSDMNDWANKLVFKTYSKCQNCYKRKICRYCPGRFFLETGRYDVAPDFYCDMADALIYEFSNSYKFELYNFVNKIPKEKYKLIYKIIIDNYFERNKDLLYKKNEIDTEDVYKSWINTITNTDGYNILLCYLNDKIVAFCAYMYVPKGLCLSEVQIKRDYQGKYDILRKLLKEVIETCDKDKSKIICGTINPKNIKSINVFTHIGMKNTEGKWYEISYDNLIKWIYSF